MAGKDFKAGDLVWAKMKGFPFWPARIEKHAPKPPNVKIAKVSHYVFFFGTKNWAWISDECIVPHSEEMIKSCVKKKSSSMQSAIDEIIALSTKVSKKAASLPPGEPSTSEEAAPKKSAEIPKKLAPKGEEAKKKTPKKRPSADSSLANPSSPKSRKVKTENVSPGHSRTAVIHPYDEDPTRPQTSGVGTKPNVIEQPTSSDAAGVSDTLQERSASAEPQKIGFLGLGMLGQGVVKNLLKAGHDVSIWNRTPEKCEPFVRSGATQCANPSEVISKCDITFCCVSDPKAATMVALGNDGVVQGLKGCVPGSKGYIEMTTIDPTTSQKIAKAISDAGGRYLEAPVNGSKHNAEEGSLMILAAGDKELFNSCKSCFSAFTKTACFLSGSVGCGSKINLARSMLFGTTYAALAEAMVLIECCQLSQGNFLEILDLGPLSSSLLLDRAETMLSGEYFSPSVNHLQKDLRLALSLGNDNDQPLTIASSSFQFFNYLRQLMRSRGHNRLLSRRIV